MRSAMFFGALAAVVLVPSTGWAQPGPGDDSQQLRRLIETLEKKLDALEGGGESKRRVTQLGTGMRSYAEEPTMVVRIYDLGDLFALAPAYPAMRTDDLGGQALPLFPGAADRSPSGTATGMGGMGGMGMGGGGAFRVKDLPNRRPAEPTRPLRQVMQPTGGTVASARTSLDQLIDAITSTISPTDWDEVGGECSIAPLGTSLLISATEDMHEQIDSLFDSFRARWGTLRTISIQTHWLWLTEEQLARLLVPRDAEAAPTDGPTDQPEAELPAFGIVDAIAWKDLIGQLQRPGERDQAGYHAVVTCTNGQTVSAVSGGQRLAVTRVVPVDFGSAAVGENTLAANVEFDPQPVTIQEGAALQVTAISSTSGKYVTLDVHSRVVEVCEQPQRRPAPAALQAQAFSPNKAAQVVSALDRPQLMNHRFSTTLRLPVDCRMLIGGMTYESQPKPGDPGLYLFMKVAMQELRDDEPEEDPQPDDEPKAEPDQDSQEKENAIEHR